MSNTETQPIDPVDMREQLVNAYRWQVTLFGDNDTFITSTKVKIAIQPELDSSSGCKNKYCINFMAFIANASSVRSALFRFHKEQPAFYDKLKDDFHHESTIRASLVTGELRFGLAKYALINKRLEGVLCYIQDSGENISLEVWFSDQDTFSIDIPKLDTVVKTKAKKEPKRILARTGAVI